MAELTRDELIQMVDECLHENNCSLTSWEEQFLESIADKLDRQRRLSEYEVERVEEIHERVI